ncbi:MAG: CRTAC1 family protein [Phycisphaerales bacterium]|jgi:hypothetical protein
MNVSMMKGMTPGCCRASIAALFLAAGVASAQEFVLEDVSRDAGIDQSLYQSAMGMIAGVVAADYDNDGHIDFFVPNAEGMPDLLYVNNGDGTFTERASELGVSGGDGADKPRSRVALWFDYDGDRRLDLIVAGDSFFTSITEIEWGWATPRLYRQLPDGTFEDVSDATGISDLDLVSDHRGLDPGSGALSLLRHIGSLAAGDVNGDGHVDLMIGLWSAAGENDPDEIGARLLLNLPDADTGGRTFEDVSIDVFAPGVADPGVDHFGSFWQIVMHDFDGDGLLDIYGACDMDKNHMWINQGSFEDPGRPGVMLLNPMLDITDAAGVTDPMPETDMGVSIADTNADGVMDIFVTITDTPGSALHNNFFLSQSDEPTYIEAALEAGVSQQGGKFGWGWGTTFQDMDRDGWPDLLITNGFNSCVDRPRMMIHDGDPSNVHFTEQVSDALTIIERGSTIIGADLNRDGCVDLLHTVMLSAISAGCDESAIKVLQNKPDDDEPQASYVTVRPRMEGANFHAIGAVVQVELDGAAAQLDMIRTITAGISMAGQEPAEAYFGLGADAEGDDPLRVTIRWPGGVAPTVIEGTVDSIGNQVLHVGPCSVVDLDGTPGLDFFDLLAFVNLFELGDMRTDLAAPFGTLDFFDVLEAIQMIEDGCP